MDDKQTINCSVSSCKFNDCQKQMCELEQIVVRPCPNCNTASTDESECGSYECKNNCGC